METEKIKIIEEIFKLIGAPTEEVAYEFHEKRGHIFKVKSSEFEKISLNREDITRDLIYLLKRIFNKNTTHGEEMFKCTIDINDQQSKADAHIKMKALNAAEEARNLKTDVTMDAMSSYERMIAHSTLAGMPDITTESVGEGRDRRLKVKYLSI